MARDPEFLLEATTLEDPEVLAEKNLKVPQVPVEELQAGDVLLSRGIGWLSDLIAGVDGGTYSHAAYYDGAKIIQATKKGVRQMDAELVKGAQVFVDAYRFKSPGNRTFGQEFPSKPVTDFALASLKKPFSYNDLFGALVVLTVRRLTPGNWTAKWEAALRLAILLEKELPIDKNSEKVTCTELVTRCFWDASQAEKISDYGIRIRYSRARAFHFESTQKALQSDSFVALQREAAELLVEMRPDFSPTEALASHATAGLKSSDPVIGGSKQMPAQYVTPFDLEYSQSLDYMGRVWTA